MKKQITIDFYNDAEEYDFSASLRAYMKRSLMEALRLFEIEQPVQVSVSFVDEETIREYNKENRDVDRVTDVLSFPLQSFYEGKLDENSVTDGELDENGNLMLGDVVICISVCMRQAEEFGHSIEREAVYLFTHSILHLMGFDHMEEEEKSRMREKEEIIMERIGLARNE